MLKKKLLSSPIRQALMLLSIPLTLSSTGYALFSQQLSVITTATNPAYTSSQNLRATYVKTSAPSGQTRTYTVNVTITNNGNNGVTAWQSDFSLPSNFSQVTCTSSTCTQANLTNTAVNTGTNGTINPGGSVTYQFTFKSPDQTYRFTSIAISGTPAVIYETITGLSVNAVAGTTTRSGKNYVTPYTFTVTNNSGLALTGWRIQAPWNTTTTVSSMSATVNYTVTATQLTILSTQGIVNNATFQFNGTFSSTSSTWVLSGLTIQGVR